MQSIDTRKTDVELIQSETERVKQYINALPPEALEHPSPCEMWNVGEVIAHLDWFAETYGGMMERGLRGDLSPTEGFPAPGILSTTEVQKLYGQAAIDRRQSLGPNLLAAFNQRYDWLNDLLSGIRPEDWDKPCYHTYRLRSVESFIPTIVTELAVHEWDIRSTIEDSPSISVSSIPILVDRIPVRTRPWAVAFPATSGSQGPIRYSFELTGVGARKLDLVVEDNKARLAHDGDDPANVSVSCDTGTFVLLMWDRMSLDSADSSGHLSQRAIKGK